MLRRTPANFLDLRVAIAGLHVVRFWYQGEEIEIEPHALLQAGGSEAFVVVGWRDGWEFYRYADMRDLVFTDRFFEPRGDVPQRVPLGTTKRD